MKMYTERNHGIRGSDLTIAFSISCWGSSKLNQTRKQSSFLIFSTIHRTMTNQAHQRQCTELTCTLTSVLHPHKYSAQTKCDMTSFHEVESRELKSSKVPQVQRVKDQPGLYKPSNIHPKKIRTYWHGLSRGKPKIKF